MFSFEEEVEMPILPKDARNLTYELLLGTTIKKPK